MDDLTFSGEKYPSGLQKEIARIVEHHHYKINHKKSQLLYNHQGKMIVTGVDIGKNYPTISRDYRRQLRSELDWSAKHQTSFSKSLLGKMEWVRQVNQEQYFELLEYYQKRKNKCHTVSQSLAVS